MSGNFKYSGPGGSVGNLNLSYERFWFDQSETSARRGVESPDRLRTLTGEQKRSSLEIGGDYELGLGGGRLKLIGLRKMESGPADTLVVTAFSDGAATIGNPARLPLFCCLTFVPTSAFRLVSHRLSDPRSLGRAA